MRYKNDGEHISALVREKLMFVEIIWNLMRTLELPLLFHSGGPPNVKRWEEIIHTREMTTKMMCDEIRRVRSKVEEALTT